MFCNELVLQKREKEHVPTLKRGGGMFVFNNNSVKREFRKPAAAQVRMFVNIKSVIVFCICCFNDMDSCRHEIMTAPT